MQCNPSKARHAAPKDWVIGQSLHMDQDELSTTPEAKPRVAPTGVDNTIKVTFGKVARFLRRVLGIISW